jgi:hypothetical protein
MRANAEMFSFHLSILHIYNSALSRSYLTTIAHQVVMSHTPDTVTSWNLDCICHGRQPVALDVRTNMRAIMNTRLSLNLEATGDEKVAVGKHMITYGLTINVVLVYFMMM